MDVLSATGQATCWRSVYSLLSCARSSSSAAARRASGRKSVRTPGSFPVAGTGMCQRIRWLRPSIPKQREAAQLYAASRSWQHQSGRQLAEEGRAPSFPFAGAAEGSRSPPTPGCAAAIGCAGAESACAAPVPSLSAAPCSLFSSSSSSSSSANDSLALSCSLAFCAARCSRSWNHDHAAPVRGSQPSHLTRYQYQQAPDRRRTQRPALPDQLSGSSIRLRR